MNKNTQWWSILFGAALFVIIACAKAATVATVTPAPWGLYSGATKTKTLASQQECIDAAKALGVVKSYTCRTRTGVSITISTDPVISWAAPTTYTDGSLITDLTGYKVYCGTTAQNIALIGSTAQTSYTITGIPSGSYTCGVTTTTVASESDLSALVTKVVQ